MATTLSSLPIGTVEVNLSHIWVFPKIGVPENGWFNNGKLYEQMDDLEGFAIIFGSTPIWLIRLCSKKYWWPQIRTHATLKRINLELQLHENLRKGQEPGTVLKANSYDLQASPNLTIRKTILFQNGNKNPNKTHVHPHHFFQPRKSVNNKFNWVVPFFLDLHPLSGMNLPWNWS